MFTFKGDGFPSFHGITPQIHEEAFVAPQVFLSGDVRVGQYASLWPGVVARGDVNYISVGACSNIQDLTCLHVADDNPCIIGDYVTVGHSACVHGCEIEDHVLIGMGAIILTGAKIGRGSIIGIPGKIVRENIDRIATIHAQALKYKCEWAIEYGVYPEIGGERFNGEKVI